MDEVEAIEAAARAIRNNTVFRNPPDNDLAAALSAQARYEERGWDDITDEAKAMWLSDAKAALDAISYSALLAELTSWKRSWEDVKDDAIAEYGRMKEKLNRQEAELTRQAAVVEAARALKRKKDEWVTADDGSYFDAPAEQRALTAALAALDTP